MLGPNITGGLDDVQTSWDTGYPLGNGAVYTSFKGANSIFNGNKNNVVMFNFDASRCSAIYGSSSTVQPSSICVNVLIKY